MNGRVAGCLRGTIYGEFSHRGTKYTRGHDGAIRCEGRRKVYLTAKKEHKLHSETIHKLKSKGRGRPRWLLPKKRDQ